MDNFVTDCPNCHVPVGGNIPSNVNQQCSACGYTYAIHSSGGSPILTGAGTKTPSHTPDKSIWVENCPSCYAPIKSTLSSNLNHECGACRCGFSIVSGIPTVMRPSVPSLPSVNVRPWDGHIRISIPPETVEEAVVAVVAWLKFQIKQKGDGAYSSPHEAMGVIQEEVEEFNAACHDNNPVEFVKEAIDIAVGAIWAIASNRREYWELPIPLPPDDKRGDPLPSESEVQNGGKVP